MGRKHNHPRIHTCVHMRKDKSFSKLFLSLQKTQAFPQEQKIAARTRSHAAAMDKPPRSLLLPLSLLFVAFLACLPEGPAGLPTRRVAFYSIFPPHISGCRHPSITLFLESVILFLYSLGPFRPFCRPPLLANVRKTPTGYVTASANLLPQKSKMVLPRADD